MGNKLLTCQLLNPFSGRGRTTTGMVIATLIQTIMTGRNLPLQLKVPKYRAFSLHLFTTEKEVPPPSSPDLIKEFIQLQQVKALLMHI
jgi:hypothetical protein